MSSQTISLLGSTGSIGRQTLEVARELQLKVAALAAGRSVDLMEAQAREFLPELAVLYDMEAAVELARRLKGLPVRVAYGLEGLLEAAAIDSADTLVTALVGMVGLQPTLAAIEKGKRIALANKETLVCAGELVMARAEARGAEIIPVDSEHSAIFQCLQGCRDRGEVRRLILTCSGGPFYGRRFEELQHVTAAEALRHPNWSMGAMRLYRMPLEQVTAVIHRQSIVHSLVEFRDGAVLAQLGTPDMKLPIRYALTYPKRAESAAEPLDLLACPPLTFALPDREAFPCLRLAMDSVRAGGTACAALNGANEAAVGRFLRGEIGFGDIPRLVERALERWSGGDAMSLAAIVEADRAAREAAMENG